MTIGAECRQMQQRIRSQLKPVRRKHVTPQTRKPVEYPPEFDRDDPNNNLIVCVRIPSGISYRVRRKVDRVYVSGGQTQDLNEARRMRDRLVELTGGW